MKIDKKGRDTLKSYFVKNAVPTASNFEDLINAGINQSEDGIAKLPGEPLSLQADGDDASQKKLLNLYRSFNDLAPAWALALNPRANPADPASANPGFSIGDAIGVSRLFIDQATGRLGVGTVKPAMQLDVVGVVRVMANNNANKDPDSRLDAGGNLVLKGNAPQIDFIDTDNNNKDWAIHVNANKMYFIREPWIFTDLVLDGAGNIGMGTDAPRAKLEVRGGAIMPSFGPGEDAGLFFPPDPAGGSGDRAWLRYYTRGGESCTLELGIANEPDDHIALMASGNVGVGMRDPAFKLDVIGALRVTGSSGAYRDPDSKLTGAGTLMLKSDAPQIDFIDTDNKDWAIHVNANKMYFIREPWICTDLVLDGAGNIGMGTDAPRAKLEVRGGAIMPSFGPGEDAGLFFPPDPAGGGGDRAWLRYYTRGGESCTLELGIANDADDHIALMASGGVGIGTNNPQSTLDVRGGIFAGNSDIYFTKTDHDHIGSGNKAGWAAIENAANYKCLMILGRNVGTDQALNRVVGVWDTLQVQGRVVLTSDRNAKRDIEPLRLGLAEVLRLEPVAFNWKSIDNAKKSIGLIAQDVQSVIDQVVFDSHMGEDSRLGIAYDGLIPVLINAVKELANRLAALEPRPAV